jgi:hypothetical protein
MDGGQHEFNHAYVLHGSGGITTVQSRLVGHGVCSGMFWNPCPPDWRFRVRTYLTPGELHDLLEDVSARFRIQCYLDTIVFELDTVSL